MKKVKQISAMAGIVIIVSMYIISIISAIFASEYAPGLFLASIFSTLVIPIMIYGFMAVYKHVHKNDNDSMINDDTPDPSKGE